MAPSVLQEKRTKAKQDRKTHRSSSAGLSHLSHTVTALPASLDREPQRSSPAIGLSNGGPNKVSPSLAHEDSDCINADVAHEVGSTSSTSTASSLFSANNREANMVYQNGPHKSTSLTPLTNIDSSPRTNGINSPRKRSIYDQHQSSNPPKSPTSSHVSEKHISASDPKLTSVGNQARPRQGEIKGFKAIYDPILDKNLRGHEKKTRQVQYEAFGEEVRSI